MEIETTLFGGLFAVQFLGAILVLVALTPAGPGPLSIAGGILIVSGIGGLAATTGLIGETDRTVHLSDGAADRLLQFVRRSKR